MNMHTPGSWYSHPHSEHGDCDYEIYDERAESIAYVSARPGAEAEANARLMRASPELLDALDDIVRHIHMDIGMQRRAQDAINKARGVQ